VRVTNAALAVQRTATTDGTGFYRVTALPAGTYTISASHSGFASKSYTDLELTLTAR